MAIQRRLYAHRVLGQGLPQPLLDLVARIFELGVRVDLVLRRIKL